MPGFPESLCGSVTESRSEKFAGLRFVFQGFRSISLSNPCDETKRRDVGVQLISFTKSKHYSEYFAVYAANTVKNFPFNTEE